jgi:hypothetical protein
MTAPEITSSPRAASPRLRVWLIIATVLGAIGIIAAIPTVLFGTYMAAFAADDPHAAADAAWNMMLGVWGAGLGCVILIALGVAGSWIAYRSRRNRASFGFSLLAAAPVILLVLGFVVVSVISFVWTASIR